MPAQRYCIPDPTAAMTDDLIKRQIAANSRVIDLGCGDGRLLTHLRDAHGCSVLGVELDHERIKASMTSGVPVICANLDDGLPDVPDDAFDIAVLSQTLQQVLHPKKVMHEMMRIARRSLVVVPNFGHWRVRLQLFWSGRAPVTSTLPYEWYDTPNVHLMTMRDFRDLAEQIGCRIVKELPIVKGRAKDRAWAANLRADSAMYVLERPATR